jgi:hypothetical protein
MEMENTIKQVIKKCQNMDIQRYTILSNYPEYSDQELAWSCQFCIDSINTLEKMYTQYNIPQNEQYLEVYDMQLPLHLYHLHLDLLDFMERYEEIKEVLPKYIEKAIQISKNNQKRNENGDSFMYFCEELPLLERQAYNYIEINEDKEAVTIFEKLLEKQKEMGIHYEGYCLYPQAYEEDQERWTEEIGKLKEKLTE